MLGDGNGAIEAPRGRSLGRNRATSGPLPAWPGGRRAGRAGGDLDAGYQVNHRLANTLRRAFRVRLESGGPGRRPGLVAKSAVVAALGCMTGLPAGLHPRDPI